MRKLRLAVCLPNAADVAVIAMRLHGATVEPCGDPAGLRGPPEGCDAVMLAGAGQQVKQLLAAGIHVLLVADPCPPDEAIEALYAAARASEVQLAVVNPDRHLPSRQLIRKQVGGPLGEPGLIRLHRWEPAKPDPPGGLPDPLLRDLDVTLWLAGRRPDRVFAVGQVVDGRYVQVHLGFPGGGMALLDYDGRLPAGDGYQSLHVIASTGAAYADDYQNTQLLYRGGCPQAVRTEERAGQLAAIAQDFIDGLRTGRDPSTEADWRSVSVVADAVRRSLASGNAVAVEDR